MITVSYNYAAAKFTTVYAFVSEIESLESALLFISAFTHSTSNERSCISAQDISAASSSDECSLICLHFITENTSNYISDNDESHSLNTDIVSAHLLSDNCVLHKPLYVLSLTDSFTLFNLLFS